MVRGLALRSLSSLRMESMLEYVEQPMKKALQDVSPYVRKTGVMACLKVIQISTLQCIISKLFLDIPLIGLLTALLRALYRCIAWTET